MRRALSLRVMARHAFYHNPEFDAAPRRGYSPWIRRRTRIDQDAWFLTFGLAAVLLAVLGVIRLRERALRRRERALAALVEERKPDVLEESRAESEPANASPEVRTPTNAVIGEPRKPTMQPLRDETGEIPPGLVHPLRILLAEDNSVNQKVALLLLERLGYAADLAANGLEVLDALRRQDYDVILMDVQMPEMDGLETARRIAADPPRGQRPRIIAITASARRGDREACLAAGMQDYLSKPILLEDLWAALLRTEPVQPAAGEQDPVLDPVYLERLLDLQRQSGRTVVPLIVDSFVTEWPRRLERMRGAVARGDRQDLVLVAHTLKGGSAQLGALRVASLSRELEESGKEGQLDGAGELLDRLERELESASAALLAHSGVQEEAQEKAQEAGAPPS
jgi:CheY-like chemotaxis protein